MKTYIKIIAISLEENWLIMIIAYLIFITLNNDYWFWIRSYIIKKKQTKNITQQEYKIEVVLSSLTLNNSKGIGTTLKNIFILTFN